jgi:hypothetical protein
MQPRVVEKAGRWKARKTKSRFSSLPPALGNPAKPRGIPTFPTAPTAAGISQTKPGILIVVDRKECFTPDSPPLTHKFLRRGKSAFLSADARFGIISSEME